MQPAQVGARLHADLLDQRGPRLPVGLERVRLTAAAVQSEHALPMQALAQRLPGQQRLELRQHLAVAPGLEVLVNRDLERGGAQLVQAPDLGRGERLLGHVAQRRAAPETQRLARGTLRQQPLEPRGIHPMAPDTQLVPAAARGDRAVVGAAGHRLAQVRDVQLHELRRRGRRVIAPQTVDQTLHRDGRAGLQREHGQQRALLRTAEGDRRLVRDHLDGSEQMHVHVHFPDLLLRSYVGRGPLNQCGRVVLIQCAHRGLRARAEARHAASREAVSATSTWPGPRIRRLMTSERS